MTTPKELILEYFNENKEILEKMKNIADTIDNKLNESELIEKMTAFESPFTVLLMKHGTYSTKLKHLVASNALKKDKTK